MGLFQLRRGIHLLHPLVSTGGVIAAFAEGHMDAEYQGGQLIKPFSSDVVAGYIDPAWNWSTVVGEVNKRYMEGTHRAWCSGGRGEFGCCAPPHNNHEGQRSISSCGRLGCVLRRWVLEGGRFGAETGCGWCHESHGWQAEWTDRMGRPQTTPETDLFCFSQGERTEFIASGGSGVVMEDGTLVFPQMAVNEAEDVCSMIICLTDSGSAWALSEYISPAKCLNPHVTEWEGSLLMIVDCENGQRVYESRDMGTAWTEAIGTLSAVWVNARSGVSQKESLRVDALITATIEERKVMLYTQRGYASGKKRATAF
ncbi:BNR repeat-like domain [Trypanosoma cruzi]|uniref:BNR repeat-like domain n=1 Tax=Trypanosoma cruzi TaxID=5693 RepID=A0A7J6XR94_TRYCR|nr:BNR repeat-like domain [Trypanosoma cruzi]